MSDIYSNIDYACKIRGTSISAVLDKLGRAKSSATAWKNGTAPNVKVCKEIADCLGISIDELISGKPVDNEVHISRTAPDVIMSPDAREWLNLYYQIPVNKRYAIKTFILQMIPVDSPGLPQSTEGEKLSVS